MAFEFVSTREAIARDGLRMVVVGHIPSPWGEAAKGILHVKGIDWTAVRLDHRDDDQKKWARERSGPVAIYNDERPRAGWSEILLLAERLNPHPPLLPSDPANRALAMGLAHEFCGEQGLGWARRMQLVHAGFAGEGGFHPKAGEYLVHRYGTMTFTPEMADERVRALLRMFSNHLRQQRQAGSDYYIGDRLTAVDIYSATFAGLVKPYPDDLCAMDPRTRVAFETLDEETAAAADPILFEHRDRIYQDYLELPLKL